MTKNRDLKTKIRARMAKTGERYTAARAHLLTRGARPGPAAAEGVLAGYPGFGGVQEGTAPLVHLLEHAGVRFPGTGEPYTEAQLHGLCGGPGFLYAVFEYRGEPPMLTIVARSRSMPQAYLEPVFARLGVEPRRVGSSSENAAAKKLERALAEGRPALCLVDSAFLPHSGTPRSSAGMGPTHVAVVGAGAGAGSDPESGHYWLDDRARVPLPIDRASFAAAQSAYRKGKRAMITFEDPGVDSRASGVDWQRTWREALVDTVHTLRQGDPTVPPSFRSNCGFAGMEKWRRLLVDDKDRKGWPRVFASGPDAFVGLRRAYDAMCRDYTAPAAGRPLYATFLRQAADGLDLEPGGRRQLGEAAGAFERAGEGWSALAEIIAATPDPAVERVCRITDERTRALDEGDLERLDALAEERRGLAAACRLSKDDAQAVYSALAEGLGPILGAERAAVDALAAALDL